MFFNRSWNSGKLEKHIPVLLYKLQLPLPNKAKMLLNVVGKTEVI